MRRYSQAGLIVAVVCALTSMGWAQGRPAPSRVEVISWPGVFGDKVPRGGYAGNSPPVGVKVTPLEPMVITGKRTLEAPKDAGVSLLVFSRRHRNGQEAQGSITLAPGAKATINPAAIERDTTDLIEVEEGSIRVIKEPKSPGTFRVRTPIATMAVRGTELWVRHTPAAEAAKKGATLAVVRSGTVAATAGGQKADIETDFMLEADDAAVKPVAPVTDEVIKQFDAFRFEPTAERWILYDDSDLPPHVPNARIAGTGRTTLANALPRRFEGNDWFVRPYAPLVYSVWLPPTNIASYRYLVLRVRGNAAKFKVFFVDDSVYANTFTAEPAHKPVADWAYVVLVIEEGMNLVQTANGKIGKSTMVTRMHIGVSRDKPDAEKNSEWVDFKEIVLLRDLPAELKDRVIHLEKPKP